MIETSTCPGCGGVIEKEDRFCQECGRALSTVRVTGPKSTLEKMHAFRAEFILVAAVVIYAVSVVCWTDRTELKNLAHLPAGWFAKNQTIESKSTYQRSTTSGITVKQSPDSELQRLFSKSATFPSVPVGAGRALPTKTPALVATGTAVPTKAIATTVAPAPATKKLIAQKQTGPDESASDPTIEPASEAANEQSETKKKSSKHVKADPKAIADVAEYNRLLAEYFARKKPEGEGAESAGEPPSYQEWIAGRKPFF